MARNHLADHPFMSAALGTEAPVIDRAFDIPGVLGSRGAAAEGVCDDPGGGAVFRVSGAPPHG
jgi:hypothetical protein